MKLVLDPHFTRASASSASAEVVLFGFTMLLSTALAHAVGISPIGRDGSSDSPPQPHRPAVRHSPALVAWCVGADLVVVAASTAWMLLAPLAYDELPSGAVLATWELAASAALACGLVCRLAQAFLPRAAAIAATGAWLLLSCRDLASPPTVLDRAAAFLAFPVSPSLIATDEAARLGSASLAAGSVGLFDLGLLALWITVEARGSR